MSARVIKFPRVPVPKPTIPHKVKKSQALRGEKHKKPLTRESD